MDNIKSCACEQEMGLCGKCQANGKLIEDIQCQADRLREMLMGPAGDTCNEKIQAPDCVMADLISQFERLKVLLRTLESIRI